MVPIEAMTFGGDRYDEWRFYDTDEQMRSAYVEWEMGHARDRT